MPILNGKTRIGPYGGVFAQLLDLGVEFSKRGENSLCWSRRLRRLWIIGVAAIEGLPLRQVGESAFFTASPKEVAMAGAMGGKGGRDLVQSRIGIGIPPDGGSLFLPE